MSREVGYPPLLRWMITLAIMAGVMTWLAESTAASLRVQIAEIQEAPRNDGWFSRVFLSEERRTRKFVEDKKSDIEVAKSQRSMNLVGGAIFLLPVAYWFAGMISSVLASWFASLSYSWDEARRARERRHQIQAFSRQQDAHVIEDRQVEGTRRTALALKHIGNMLVFVRIYESESDRGSRLRCLSGLQQEVMDLATLNLESPGHSVLQVHGVRQQFDVLLGAMQNCGLGEGAEATSLRALVSAKESRFKLLR